MKTSSCKAKGRRCSTDVKELLLKYAPDLKESDINVVPSGVTGPDLWMSPAAQGIYNFAIECKNVERLNIHEAIAQAMSHAKGTNKVPVLFFKRNLSPLFVALSAEDFIKLIR